MILLVFHQVLFRFSIKAAVALHPAMIYRCIRKNKQKMKKREKFHYLSKPFVYTHGSHISVRANSICNTCKYLYTNTHSALDPSRDRVTTSNANHFIY